MGRRLIVAVGLALAVGAGVAVAAGSPHAFTLRAGQVRWFLPDELRAGDLVGCVVGGRELDVTIPPRAAGQAVSKDAFAGGGSGVSLEVKPNGAVQVRCGPTGGETVRRAVYPYVVGPNGLGLIRGPNTLARVERVYGHGVPASGGGVCRVTWRPIGLTAVFAGGRCASVDPLSAATVTGRSWSSLSGVHVGDPVARMVWEDQTAKLVSRSGGHTTWLLGGVGRTRHAKLLAVAGSTITVFALRPSG